MIVSLFDAAHQKNKSIWGVSIKKQVVVIWTKLSSGIADKARDLPRLLSKSSISSVAKLRPVSSLLSSMRQWKWLSAFACMRSSYLSFSVGTVKASKGFHTIVYLATPRHS
jgi:hypothetical protein